MSHLRSGYTGKKASEKTRAYIAKGADGPIQGSLFYVDSESVVALFAGRAEARAIQSKLDEAANCCSGGDDFEEKDGEEGEDGEGGDGEGDDEGDGNGDNGGDGEAPEADGRDVAGQQLADSQARPPLLFGHTLPSCAHVLAPGASHGA
jgi:hypothetical protein